MVNKMNFNKILKILKDYREDFNNILNRFIHTSNGIHMRTSDRSSYEKDIIELKDFINDILGKNKYVYEIEKAYIDGLNNFLRSPSYRSVEQIISIIDALITRIQRNKDIVKKKEKKISKRINEENVFIIHGKDEARWREIKDIIKDDFNLKPIILSEQPDTGATIIEKFEKYAKSCSCAIAIFTPDDEVISDNVKYLQARPNVIYEIGWFCGKLGRDKVILLLKEGTTIFSDFGGIIQKRFKEKIIEKVNEIRKDLEQMNIIKR